MFSGGVYKTEKEGGNEKEEENWIVQKMGLIMFSFRKRAFMENWVNFDAIRY